MAGRGVAHPANVLPPEHPGVDGMRNLAELSALVLLRHQLDEQQRPAR